jgi:cell wall-associated NlpC family hydrolase
MTSAVVRRPGAPLARRVGLAVATTALTASLLPALAGSAAAVEAPITGTTTTITSTTTTLSTLAVTTTTPTPVRIDVSTLSFSADGRVQVSTAVKRDARARGKVILAIAPRYRGVPYRAGGTTPRGFDCSGYTRYVFSRMGISIPRVSRDQYRASKPISRASAVPGDLVFFYSGSGWIYHVAIYAGNGYVWHSPYPGKRVTKERIWSSKVKFGPGKRVSKERIWSSKVKFGRVRV